MIEILTRFKERREELGVSLKQAEEETRIRVDYLRAIEEGNFEYIEAEVYLRGFLKVYSAYLGLDTKEVLEAYKKLQEPELVEEEIVKKESFKEKISNSFDEHQNAVLISCLVGIGLLVIGLLAFAGFKLYGLIDDSGRMANSSPSIETAQVKEGVVLSASKKVEEEVKESEKTKENRKGTIEEINENRAEKTEVNKEDSEELNNQEVAANEINIEVETIDESWYSVEVDGKVVFKGIVAANNRKLFSGQKIELKMGNAAGIKVIKDGKVMGPFGSKGEVIVKRFSID
ncbi:hypothetical protein U472_06810 [Orenia metallireducens]|uniref:Cytoskeleton protein RodZ-like C-terminal domain-containing protein n=1 Tax=Orenia metallireducens TaxID=1413210 RepID=A0A1C0AA70_9FIRM|nr:helix-turn-helix domain-containing protein [Orenia metallireducens]OCL27181.1 hypothetical protein U472_06810 [Orenia metallireducens]